MREHFGARLKAERLEAWRAGHARLYEHLRDSAKPRPDTLAEMAPLFQAMHHGCQAGRHQEALDEVYWARIQRGQEHFNWNRLGAFGADLAALAGLFHPPWTQPVVTLTEPDQAFILNEAGFDLRALGRLWEATAPMKAGLLRRVRQKDWVNASRIAQNSSQLHLTLGGVDTAVKLGEACVGHSEKAGDLWQWIAAHVCLADALHQAGELARALSLFRDAESILAQHPTNPRRFLHGFWGHRYCELLSDQGCFAEVKQRAGQTIEWAKERPLELGLNQLSLGKAALALAEDGEAGTQLDQAVDSLRRAGQMDELPRGLMARAAFFQETGEFDLARRDLDEAMRIARRSEMRLFQCDAHLEYARLALAEGTEATKKQARGHVAEARRLVDETGYGRRRPEVEELEAEVR